MAHLRSLNLVQTITSRGENDSKQSYEIQATVYEGCMEWQQITLDSLIEIGI